MHNFKLQKVFIFTLVGSLAKTLLTVFFSFVVASDILMYELYQTMYFIEFFHVGLPYLFSMTNKYFIFS